jgi:hypothetical protein
MMKDFSLDLEWILLTFEYGGQFQLSVDSILDIRERAQPLIKLFQYVEDQLIPNKRTERKRIEFDMRFVPRNAQTPTDPSEWWNTLPEVFALHKDKRFAYETRLFIVGIAYVLCVNHDMRIDGIVTGCIRNLEER